MAETSRHLVGTPAPWLRCPLTRVQPILAKAGRPTVDLARLREQVRGLAEFLPLVAVESPEHWAQVVHGLGPEVDAILPLSIPAYPTEVWNSHPQPLVDRGLPFIFWPLLEYDEPDFWRWSARDMLRALGVDVHIVASQAHGLSLLKALAMKRFLRDSRLLVLGEQNFPWNAHAAGHLITASLGTRILVTSLDDFRQHYPTFDDAHVDAFWAARQGTRYRTDTVLPADLRQALRTTLALRAVLEETQALGFGVNCFGDLITRGGRDVPCLAQCLLREEGYIASCDGDFCAMMSMVLTTWFLERPTMMSNLYPVSYVGALRDHFGDPLSPHSKRFAKRRWANLARLAHCGYVGVVSPEMTPQGCVRLSDWGGTYEMKRDGHGCGIDGDLRPGEPVTVVELCFDGRTLLLAQARVAESTRHRGMRHCESSALLEFRDLPAFVENISREHTAVVYGDHLESLQVLARTLGLHAKVF
jgi:L-fucose isomerase-like protein